MNKLKKFLAIMKFQTFQNNKKMILLNENLNSLRGLIMSGDYFLAASLASSLTKLIIKYQEIHGHGSKDSNIETAKALLLFTAIVNSGVISFPIKSFAVILGNVND